jgi:hypothetical protein
LEITVVFGRTTPEVEGYGAIDPILEILTDVGVIRDVRQERWEREVQNAGAGEWYSLTIEPSDD